MSRNGSVENNNTKGSKKNNKKKKIIIFSILGVIILLIAAVAIFISIKLSKINFEDLNHNDLGVNGDIYDEVANNISKEEFNEIKTIAFFGIDSTDNSDGGISGRSDTIMIASINPKMNSCKLLSIPRDTYVNIDGYGKTKINHAYAYGKEQLAIKTINKNFGLNITEYVTIDLPGLINIINKVGGIELQITEDEKNYINERVSISYKISGRPVQKVSKSGLVTLTGEQALTHSRNRTVGNDFVRASRQRDVITALMTKISKMGSSSIMEIVDSMLEEVKTNINITSYMGLLTNVVTNKDEYLKNMISEQIPAAEYSGGQMINGVYYFVTDYTKAKADFIKYIYEK